MLFLFDPIPRATPMLTMIAPVKTIDTDTVTNLNDSNETGPAHVIIIPNDMYVTPYLDDCVEKYQRCVSLYGTQAVTFPLNSAKDALDPNFYPEVGYLSCHPDLDHVLMDEETIEPLSAPWA